MAERGPRSVREAGLAPGSAPSAGQASRRLNLTAAEVDRGLAQLVLAILDLLRQVLERQAVRRMEAGSLQSSEVERVGIALSALEARLGELRRSFGPGDSDLETSLDWLRKSSSAGVEDRRTA